MKENTSQLIKCTKIGMIYNDLKSLKVIGALDHYGLKVPGSNTDSSWEFSKSQH